MPEGSLAPHVYLVGEAPGRQEAETGRPFVGPAGTALRDMMREAGIDEAQIRLANALPFRPIERSAKAGLRNRRPTERNFGTMGRWSLLISALFGRSSSLRWGSPRPRSSARRPPFMALGGKCSAFGISGPDNQSSRLRIALRWKRIRVMANCSSRFAHLLQTGAITLLSCCVKSGDS